MSPKVRAAQAGGGEEPRHTTATGAKRYPEVVGSPTASATTKNSIRTDAVLLFYPAGFEPPIGSNGVPAKTQFLWGKWESCLRNHQESLVILGWRGFFSCFHGFDVDGNIPV